MFLLLAFTLILGPLSVQQRSSGISASRHAAPVPPEVASGVATALATGGVRATVGAVNLEFWWMKALPLGDGPGVSWNEVEEGTLVGVVRVSAEFRDIRGRVIKPGVYTLRYDIQPDNGDHLGTSPFRDFLLLSPAAIDADPAALGHKGTIDLSKQTIGGSHPCVWSIDPPVAVDPVLSPHTTELDHQAITMEVTVSRGGKTIGTLRFGVVLIGRIDA